MKKLTMFLSLIVLGVLVAGGVALAANVQCTSGASQCRGTSENDRILGSDGSDDIRARQGDDVVSGLAGNDDIRGGTGADRLNGNAGEDYILAFAFTEGDGTEENPTRAVDNSDDIVRGGPQGDQLFGGFGQGGRDQVFGDNGNDSIFVSQRLLRSQGLETKITRETVDCGPGDLDQVVYDDGLDTIDEESCEILSPIAPNGEPADRPSARSVQEEVPSEVELLKNAS